MRVIILSLFILVNSFSAFSQLNFECIHQYAGLGIDNVYSVYKSPDGNVWFGSSNSKAVRFDGTTYTLFSSPASAFSGVVSMAGDSAGTMYFGNTQGSIWKIQGGTASMFIPSGGTNYVIRSLFIDNTGNIWIGTEGAGIYVVSTTATVLDQFNSSSGLPGNNVFDITQNASGDIYACTNNGVWIHNAVSDSVINTSNSSLPSNIARGVRFYDNKTWIATTNGICSFDGATWMTYDISDGLASNYVTSFEIDDKGTVWCATMYGGITKISPNGIASYQTFNSDICYNNVYDITISDDGSKWLAMASQTDYSYPVGTCRISCVAPEIDLQFGTYCFPNDNIEIINNSGQTDALTQYEWDIFNDANPEATTEDFNDNIGNYGIIPFKLTAINDYCVSELVDSITIGYIPEITINTSTALTFCSGTDCNATAIIENDTTGLIFSFLWSNGNSNNTTTLTQTGQYSVSVTNESCTETATVSINSITPYDSQELCIVSVDPLTNKNVIAWEPATEPSVTSYNIYRELSTNYFQWIANIPAGTSSTYTDLTSEPNVHAEKYKISIVDTCGNESTKSAYHKTINLSVGAGVPSTTVILLWNDYVDESATLIPDYYYIFRGATPDNMSVLDSISASFTSYNDINADSIYCYAVGIKIPSNCTGNKNTSNEFAISNVEKNFPESVSLTTLNADLKISPNPSIDYITLSYNSAPQSLTYIVTDITGKEIARKQSHSNITTFDISKFVNGLYFITMQGTSGKAIMFVKE